MAFIDKKDPVVLNIKLTSKGRELLSKGNLKFKYFAIGDSEIDYNFIAETGVEAVESNILKPLDNNPNVLSFITKTLSGDPYNVIPSIGSEYLVTNTTDSIGFFANISANTFTFATDPNHVKQANAMVDISTGIVASDELILKKIPSVSWDGVEPTVNDTILIKWTLNGDTTSYASDRTEPTPFLIYEITQIISGTLASDSLRVKVDRKLPDFNGTGKAGVVVYKPVIDFSGDTLFNFSPDYLDESVLAFLQNSQCPTVIFPFWNMSIIFTENIAGVLSGYKTYGQYDSKKYAGFVSYIQNQAPVYKKLGVIHYTNSSPANVYAEGFYLNTPELFVPTIMWHKSTETKLGAKFIAGNEFTLDGLDAHYYELVDASNPTVVVGKIFDELKLFVIEDPELLFAMSYKSNRSWTLPNFIGAAGGGCAEAPPIYSLKTYAGIAGSIQSTGGYDITEAGDVTEYGMQFKKLSDTTWSSTIRGITLPVGVNYFRTDIGNIDANTDYEYRAYVKYGTTLITGDILTIRTLPAPVVPVLPTVSMGAISNIQQTTATGTATVVTNGGATVTARGIIWSTSPTPLDITLSTKTTDTGDVGAFVGSLIGLTPSTLYYVRAYATNSVGTSYSTQTTFTSAAVAATSPTVTTAEVIAIVETGAKSGGNVTSDGGASVTARGVVINTTANPTITSYTHKIDNGSGTGGFLSLISGLNPATTYHIRAYATNSVGTSYGSDLTFTTTAAASLPTVTGFIDIIGQTTATIDGTVTSDGGASVTERGTAYSTSTGPTIAGTHTSDGSGTGAFSSSLGTSPNSPLLAGTTYYFRAYATNSVGTAYGAQDSFTTLAAATPVFMKTTLSNLPEQFEAELETTPANMIAGNCFNLTVTYDLGMLGKSSAIACVTCNGLHKYRCVLSTNIMSPVSDSGMWGPFIVKDTDTVVFCVRALESIPDTDPYASISLSSVSNVVGTYMMGSPNTIWAGNPIA